MEQAEFGRRSPKFDIFPPFARTGGPTEPGFSLQTYPSFVLLHETSALDLGFGNGSIQSESDVAGHILLVNLVVGAVAHGKCH